MIIIFLGGALLICAELFFAFIYIKSRYGHNFYTLRSKFVVYRYDKLLGYRMAPNFRYSNPRLSYPKAPRKREFVDLRTDKNGFLFDEDIDQLIRIKKKIVFCLGGSTTAGLESAYDQTYPSQLDHLIQPLGYKSINAGLGGARSIHELLIFKHVILKYKPAAIVLFSGHNDYESYAYKVYAPYNPHVHYLTMNLTRNIWESVLSYSTLYFLIRKRFGITANIRPNDTSRFQDVLDKPLWLEEWKSNIRQIIDACAENNIKCFLSSVVSPAYAHAPLEAKRLADSELDMNGRFDQWEQFNHLINDAASELCHDGAAHFIDVRPYFENYLSRFGSSDYFKERFSLFVDRVHFSELGNRILAQAIYGLIGAKL